MIGLLFMYLGGYELTLVGYCTLTVVGEATSVECKITKFSH